MVWHRFSVACRAALGQHSQAKAPATGLVGPRAVGMATSLRLQLDKLAAETKQALAHEVGGETTPPRPPRLVQASARPGGLGSAADREQGDEALVQGTPHAQESYEGDHGADSGGMLMRLEPAHVPNDDTSSTGDEDDFRIESV